MTSFEFLNVDLEIHSRVSLEPLLSELGDGVCILYSDAKPNKHFANVEIGRCWKNPSPDKTIAALCDALERLSPKARAIWKKARSKVFDIGLDIDPKSSHSYLPLSQQSLRRIADLGATITITCYNRSNFRQPPKTKSTSTASSRIAVNDRESKKELKRGKLKFSSSTADLKNSLESGRFDWHSSSAAKPSKPVKAKIIKRPGKHPVGDIGRPITREEIKKALNEFP